MKTKTGWSHYCSVFLQLQGTPHIFIIWILDISGSLIENPWFKRLNCITFTCFQNENSDGNVVSGEYRVLLPDGRTQIVR